VESVLIQSPDSRRATPLLVRDSAIVFILLAVTTSAFVREVGANQSIQVHSDSVKAMSEVSGGKCVQTPVHGVMECGVLPTDNAFVDNLLPTEPMEEQISMVLVVQDTPSVPVSRNYAFLKFNLSSVLPKAIFTSHARPLNASLWLYAEYATGFINASVRVYHASSNSWNESTLTWNNMPIIDMSHYSSNQIHAIDRWYKWNVTADVANDIEGNGTSSFALIAGFTSWSNYAWFTSRQNVTSPPELDVYFREPTLTITTPFAHLPMTIDGSPIQTDSNGTLHVGLPWGHHSVTAPDIIPGQGGVRELFVGWSDNVSSASRELNLGNNMTLHANYAKQYRLDISSPYGVAKGSDWYFVNEPANVSVQPTWVFSQGVLGWLGVRQVFDHWIGACTNSQPNCTLLMNGPKETTAVWREDYTIPIIAAIVGIAAGILALRRKKGKHKRTRKRRTRPTSNMKEGKSRRKRRGGFFSL